MDPLGTSLRSGYSRGAGVRGPLGRVRTQAAADTYEGGPRPVAPGPGWQPAGLRVGGPLASPVGRWTCARIARPGAPRRPPVAQARCLQRLAPERPHATQPVPLGCDGGAAPAPPSPPGPIPAARPPDRGAAAGIRSSRRPEDLDLDPLGRRGRARRDSADTGRDQQAREQAEAAQGEDANVGLLGRELLLERARGRGAPRGNTLVSDRDGPLHTTARFGSAPASGGSLQPQAAGRGQGTATRACPPRDSNELRDRNVPWERPNAPSRA